MYKLNWMIKHNLTFEDILKDMDKIYQKSELASKKVYDYMPSNVKWHDFIEDRHFGKFWPVYSEFDENLYVNKEFMEKMYTAVNRKEDYKTYLRYEHDEKDNVSREDRKKLRDSSFKYYEMYWMKENKIGIDMLLKEMDEYSSYIENRWGYNKKHGIDAKKTLPSTIFKQWEEEHKNEIWKIADLTPESKSKENNKGMKK